MGSIPFYPLKIGDFANSDALKSLAARENVTPALIGLAWLFHRSPAIIPIPGTSSLKHPEENAEACRVTLSARDMAVFDKLSAA
ncbi:hypothetical protein CIW50_22185 [Tardiphaga sp. P9-11]|nr:hypothetical protein CIW50_22185 [Tardiphaga sp. P9-11]